MLSINSPNPQAIADAFNHLNVDGIAFEVQEIQGLRVLIRHDHSAAEAKIAAKKIIGTLAAFKNRVGSCQIVDDKGNLL